MTAFKSDVSDQIERNIRAMFGRMRKVAGKSIQHEDFIRLFVPLSDRDMYRTMAEISTAGDGRVARYRWDDLNLVFRFYKPGESLPPPVPRHLQLQDDAPEELVSGISEWARNGGDVSGDFGRVLKVFKTLNEKFTKAQIRFVWPTIIALCNDDPANALATLAGGALLDVKPSAAVALPPGLAAACRKTAATVSLLSLIPKDIEEPALGEVRIEAACGETYSERDLETFYGLS